MILLACFCDIDSSLVALGLSRLFRRCCRSCRSFRLLSRLFFSFSFCRLLGCYPLRFCLRCLFRGFPFSLSLRCRLFGCNAISLSLSGGLFSSLAVGLSLSQGVSLRLTSRLDRFSLFRLLSFACVC